MDILRSVLGGTEPGPQVSSAETIERLVDRVNTSTLLEDRRDACRALKAMSRKFRLEVGAQGLAPMMNVLKTDGSDTEIISYVLDTLCNICSPEDFDEEVVDDNREDITGVGEGFSEMFLKNKENITLLLNYMEEFDFKIRRPAVQLLTDLLTNCTREVQQQLLDSHVGVSRLMDILGETREVLRNDALILLFKVTKGNANLQKIVAFENAFDKLFEIMEAEGWTDGGIVVEDCLRLLLNLLRNNPSNQTFFKEGSYINRIKPGLDVIETDDQGWDAQKVANMLHILQLIRTLVSPSNPTQITHSCQQATCNSGVMDQLTSILLASGIPADVLTETINTLAEVIRGDNSNQEKFMSVSAPSQPPRPAIILLLMSMVNDKQPFSLRCAVLYCFQSYLFRNPTGQGSIVSSLLPTNEQQADISAGQLLCGGLFSPDPVSNWLCSAALSHVFMDSDNMKIELLRVQLSTTVGSPPVSLISQCVKILQHAATTNMSTRFGVLQLLCAWVSGCTPAVTLLLSSPDSLSFLLNQIGSNEHDETERLSHGLCAVLLGLCILHNDGSVPGHTAHDLTTLVEKRLGSDMFLDKIGDIPKHEGYIKALKSPQLRCASTSDLLFDHMFCELFRSIDRDITGILVKKSSASPHLNGNAESGDILQYKNFIREQDLKMNQFVEANNLLHVELTNLRAQYEEVCGSVQILKDQNAILQAQAINAVTSSPITSEQQNASFEAKESLKVEDLENQLRHKDEYIAELEARLVKEDTDVNDNLDKVNTLNQSQTIEIQTLKHQLESMRAIMMNKDEEIMKLKNDLPIQRKSNAPVDRFENMFMTSMEVEAQKKKLGGFELQLKNEEIERLTKDHEKEIVALETERNEVEKELLNTKHKVDALEELTKDVSRETVDRLEEELRDAKVKIEEFQDSRDAQSLQVKDASVLENMLRESELKLLATADELRVSKEHLQQLAAYNEQLRVAHEQMQQMKITEVDTSASTATQEQLAVVTKELGATKEQLVNVTSEQEDLLMMLADQEEKVNKFKGRLRELGENVPSDDENDNLEEDDDLT